MYGLSAWVCTGVPVNNRIPIVPKKYPVIANIEINFPTIGKITIIWATRRADFV